MKILEITDRQILCTCQYMTTVYTINIEIYLTDCLKLITQIIEGIFGLFGYNTAKSDYRTFLATDKDTYPYLSGLSESLIGSPVDYYNFNGKNYSRSFLNYLLGLNFLKKCKYH